jgi:hypothetical protein
MFAVLRDPYCIASNNYLPSYANLAIFWKKPVLKSSSESCESLSGRLEDKKWKFISIRSRYCRLSSI